MTMQQQPAAAGNTTDDVTDVTDVTNENTNETATTGSAPADRSSDESTSDENAATETSLVVGAELPRLRSRWDDVQSSFVDDPRGCVQQADELVSEVVEQLTAEFSQARARLEAQWARGEEASTEDLRLALKRYREFFQRLLAV